MKSYRRRNLAVFDIDTGEKLDGMPTLIIPRKSPYGNDNWFMTSQDAVKELAKDRDITGQTYRVFMYLLSELDFENWILLSQTYIAEELNMTAQNVHRAIKVLENKAIIIRDRKCGRTSRFRLNPDFGWKGRSKHFEDVARDVDAAIGR